MTNSQPARTRTAADVVEIAHTKDHWHDEASSKGLVLLTQNFFCLDI